MVGFAHEHGVCAPIVPVACLTSTPAEVFTIPGNWQPRHWYAKLSTAWWECDLPGRTE